MASDQGQAGHQGQAGRRRQSTNGGDAPDEQRLAHELSDLARGLHAEKTLQDTLQRIADAAVENVPGAEFAGITVIEARRQVHTRAASHDVVHAADRVLNHTGDGPCLDTVYQERTFRLPNLKTEDRWPEFTRRVRALGIGSMLTFQLYVRGDNLGALNLYSRTAGSFSDESEHVGLLFASHAAVAMASAQTEEQLARGIETRDIIGQAKGILMERYRITAEQAFTVLVQSSRTTNIKLRDIAEHLAATGELVGCRR